MLACARSVPNLCTCQAWRLTGELLSRGHAVRRLSGKLVCPSFGTNTRWLLWDIKKQWTCRLGEGGVQTRTVIVSQERQAFFGRF